MLSTETSDTVSPDRAIPRKPLLALGLGNTLEWYDWMVFGLLSAYIGPHFFPQHEPVTATLNALMIFGAGFAIRPFGGALLGLLADRTGRRGVMLLSVTMMTATTLVIAVAPTYDEIGVWSPVILVVCRLVQGISTGVEAPLATAYAVELLPPGREGRAAGIMGFFVNFGILIASLTSFCTSLLIGGDAMQSWGWRVPFLVGGLLGIVIVYLRRSLPETLHSDEEPNHAQPRKAVWQQLGNHWLSVLAIVFVVGAVQSFNYAWTTGLPSLARSGFREDPSEVFAVTTLLGLLQMACAPLIGRLADRKKLSRTFVATRFLAVPTMFLPLIYAGPGIGTFAAVMLGGGLVLSLNLTLYNVVSMSLLPKSCRVTGAGLGYGIGVALFGGTASYLVLKLQQLDLPWAFPLYSAVLSVLSVVLYVAARRRNGAYAGE